MRVGVPIFQEDVAPRFGHARTMMIAEVEGDEIRATETVSLGQAGARRRLALLRDLRVETLLCAGFNAHHLPLAEGYGVHVEWGLSGPAREVLEAFARGDVSDYTFRPGQGGGPGAGCVAGHPRGGPGQGRGHGAGQGRGRGAGQGRGRGAGQGRGRSLHQE